MPCRTCHAPFQHCHPLNMFSELGELYNLDFIYVQGVQ